jgi:MFS family permease
MRQTILSLTALLTGIGILVMGSGLLGTVLAVRAEIEGFPVEVTGAVMAAYFVGLVLGSIYAVRLIERVGHIRTFAGLAAVVSAAALGFALVVSPISWAILRGLCGFCLAGLYMVTESWLNQEAPRDSRGRLLSLYMMVNLGALGGGQLLLPLSDPATFYPFCIASMLLSLGLVPVTMSRTVAPTPARIRPVSLAALYRLSPLGFASCAASGLIMGAIWAMGPVYAQMSGFDTAGVAAFMAAMVVGGIVVQWPVGALSDRFDRRRVIVLTMFAAGLACVGAIAGHGSASAAMLVLACLFGGFVFPLYSLGVANVNDFDRDENFVAISSGLLLIYGCSAAIGPMAASVVMGQIGAVGFFFYQAVVCAAFVVFGIYRLRARSSIPAEDQTSTVLVPRTSPILAGLDPRADPEDVIAEPDAAVGTG